MIVECFTFLELFLLCDVWACVWGSGVLLGVFKSLLLHLFSSTKLDFAVVGVDRDLGHGVVHESLVDAVGLRVVEKERRMGQL